MTGKMDTAEVMIPVAWVAAGTGFKPFVKYNPLMDQVTFLIHDVAYRSDRVDSFLTLFWAPDRFDLVGFKLKGFRLLFDTLKSVSDKITENDFVPFTKLLELAALAGWSHISRTADADKLEKRYETARRFVEQNAVMSRFRVSDLQLTAH